MSSWLPEPFNLSFFGHMDTVDAATLQISPTIGWRPVLFLNGNEMRRIDQETFEVFRNLFFRCFFSHKIHMVGLPCIKDIYFRYPDIQFVVQLRTRSVGRVSGKAQSWEELHAILARSGLRLRPRANGLVITAQEGTTIKASSVGREFSKPKLELRRAEASTTV
jgi:hypothetical protein